MEIFPYMLARIGGLPFSTIKQFSWSKEEALLHFLEKETALEAERLRLIKQLDEVSRALTSPKLAQYFSNLRKDLYNQRKLKLRVLEFGKEAAILIEPLLEKLQAFQKQEKDFLESKTSFQHFFDKRLEQDYLTLQGLTTLEPLQNGLLFSSRSFGKRLEQFRLVPPAQFNKKMYQTARSLLQYLSRITTKTSPFSSFTPLAMTTLQGRSIEHSNSLILLNNHLFGLFRDALQRYTPFCRNLMIQTNPTLQEKGDYWSFLFNSRNIESVQSLDQSPLLTFLFSILTENKDQTWGQLIATLLEEVEAEEAALQDYLWQLVDYGFLEFRWPFSGLDPNWLNHLLAMIDSGTKDIVLQDFRKSLDEIDTQLKEFQAVPFAKRQNLQQTLFHALQNTAEKLLQQTGLDHLEQQVNLEQMQHFKANRFDFQPERVFYEDKATTHSFPFPTQKLNQIIKDLDNLLDQLASLEYRHLRTRMEQFFKQYYHPQSNPSLLSFYEKYYEEVKSGEVAAPADLMEQRKVLREHLLEKGIWKDAQNLNLKLEDFPSLNQPKAPQHKARGTFLQMSFSEKGWIAYTDTAFVGYGKMMGRFLSLFSGEVKKAVTDWNEKLRGDQTWIENSDASLYNPNMHPPLLPLEIRLPASQNQLPRQQQISIADLSIAWDETAAELALFYETTPKKRVRIFDFGFEAPPSRSPLYRMLNIFAYRLASQEVLKDVLNADLLREKEDGVILQAQISINEHLVIQRKGWYFPLAKLPLQASGETQMAYFLRLQQWRLAENLPTQVFYSLNALQRPGVVEERSDHYKPQYLDFSSPLLVDLFARALKKVERYLKIEAMFPTPNEDLVAEYLVQWQKDE